MPKSHAPIAPFRPVKAITAALLLGAFSSQLLAVDTSLPFPGKWQAFGRASITVNSKSVTIGNGYVADLKPMADCEMSFRARALPEKEPVQIWGAIRAKDRDSRYVFGLRGGPGSPPLMGKAACQNDLNCVINHSK